MRTLLRLTTISAAIGLVSSASFISSANAQGGHSANASRFGVAVVDVPYIFEHHAQFTAAKESMKTDIQQAESKLKSEGQSIEAMAEKAKQYQPSSAEYKQLDEEVARRKAELSIKMGRIRKDFQEREVKTLYQTYLQVKQAVDYYAKQNNIGLVLRFSGNEIDPSNPKAVLSGVNQMVVSQNSIDITGDVLQMLNSGAAPAGAAPSARRPSQPRR